MSYVVDVGYALDLSQVSTAVAKFKELQTEVGKADKALNGLGQKTAKSGGEGPAKQVREAAAAATDASNKFDKLIEKNNLVRQYMVEGFTKGEASILATSKQAGILDSQFGELQKSLIQVAKLSTNPFDNSRGSVRALQKELTDLQDRIELNAKGIFASSKQLKQYSRAAEEVKGQVEQMGLALNSTKGQETYNRLLAKRRKEIEELIKSTNALVDVEKTSQRAAKDRQRTLEKVASVERRMNVRQVAQAQGVNLQDASFLIDARATGNMQLYNKALESTRKTMLQTIQPASILRGLFPAIGAVGVFAGLAIGTRQFLQMADAMRLVEARIKLVSSAGTDSTNVLTDLVAISKENRVNLDTTSRLYTRLVPALESFNVQMDGVSNATEGALKVTKAFGAALLISGANTQEAIAATTQFTQAMASGKLAGDEFRSVSEAAPAFLKAIADGSGYARSELKALSTEGKLTAELIAKALGTMEESLSARAKKIPTTMGQAFEQVKTDLMVFSRELNESTGAVDVVVDSIKTLSVIVEGLGDSLKFIKDDIIAPLNTVLGKMDTSVGQVVLGLVAFKFASASIGSVLGVAGAASVGGAALATTGAIGNLVKGMRAYTAAVALSASATGVFTTALTVARSAVTALTAALFKNPITALLAGIAVVAGSIWFNMEQAKAATEALTEEQKGSKATTEALTAANEKMLKSWDDLRKKAPQVADSIDKAFEANGVKILSDEQQRELDDIQKRIDKLKESNKGDISGRERVANNELIISLNKEYDAKSRNFALNEKINTLHGDMEGSAADMIAKLKEENKVRTEVNKLLREGVDLKLAEQRASFTTAMDQQLPFPTFAKKDGQSQEQAALLYAAQYNSILEQRAKAQEEFNKLQTSSLKLTKEQEALLDSRKESAKNPYLEEFVSLTKLLPLVKQIGDAEKARIVASGVSVETAQKLLDLRKELAVIEGTTARAEESALVQREFDLLMQGLSVKEATAILDQEALARSMASLGYSQEEIDNRLELLNLTTALKDADAERQKALEALKETYNEFLKPEKLEIGDIFGDAAQGAGALLNALYDIAEQQEEIAKWQDTINKSGLKGEAREKELAKLKKKEGQNDLANMRAITGASKQFFDEKSKGYKVLQRLEQAMFAMQVYNQAQELTGFLAGMGTKISAAATEATAFIGLEGAKATAAGTTAVAAQGQIPIVGFALAAAMAALLIGMGVSIKGGGGSGKAPTYNEGKGTVLGDSGAQSESIKNSIEALEEYARVELPITSAMLKSLRNIESNIKGLATLLIRQAPGSELIGRVQQGTTQGVTVQNLQATLFSKIDPLLGGLVGGVADKIHNAVDKLTSTLTGGLSDIGGSLINSVLGGIFGKVSTSVAGSGLTGPMQSLREVLESGFNLLEFVDIKIKKKSWFGSSTKYKTETTQADEELSRQFSLIFENFYDSILLASAPLGANLDEVAATLDDFVIDIGKINLKDKSGAELQETLEAVFGQQADLMAKAAISGFEAFQKVGEGYFETVIRLAAGIERAQFAADNFRIGLIDLADVINKRGDVPMEMLRQSLMAAEEASYGFVTGVSEIIGVFDGSIEDLEDLWLTITDVRQNLRAAGKAFEDLSISMIAGARGFENLQRGLEVYFDDFLTDQERYAELIRQMSVEFGALGYSVPETKDEFKALVTAIDTTTEAGQKLFGSIIALTPAFAELETALVTMLDEAESALLDAYDREMKALDDIIKKRDEARDALKKAYDVESKAIEKSITDLQKLGDSLRSFIKGINDTILGESATAQQATFKMFQSAAQRVRSGDTSAVDELISLGGMLSKDIPNTAESSADMVIQLAKLREEGASALEGVEQSISVAERQLLELKALVSQFIKLDEGVLSVAEAIALLQSAEVEAAQAEIQKDLMTRQLEALGLINQSVLSFADALKNYNNVKASVPKSNTDLVKDAYKQVLGRDAEKEGLDFWVNAVNSGIISIKDINAAVASGASPGGDKAAADKWLANIPKFADGGIFTNNLVTSPTAFNMGLMGEAGPEAIMPLAQASNGALGVRAMVDGSVAKGLEVVASRLETLIVENRAQQGAIASNTGKVARIIERADNGDSINVAVVTN